MNGPPSSPPGSLRPRDRRRSRLPPRAPEKVEARCRRLSRALAQWGGSMEGQPFGAGIIVVAEIALALELQRLAVGIGGGCGLDEARAQRMHGMCGAVARRGARARTRC